MSSHLEQQLAGLKLNTAEGQQPSGRKLGPAVPPKPKNSQPQVGISNDSLPRVQ